MTALPHKVKLGLWIGSMAVAALATLIAIAYGFLQTDMGRATAKSLIERALATEDGSAVTITKLTGSLTRRFRAETVTVSDGGGAWLEIENLEIEWRPLALLVGRIEVDGAQADKVHVMRTPNAKGGAARDSEGFSTLRADARIGRLAVDRILFDEAVLGSAAEFRLMANLASSAGKGVRTTLKLERTDGIEGHVRAAVSIFPADGRLTVDVSAREPAGGMLARLLELPGLPAIGVTLGGEGPIGDWRGRLSAAAEGLFSIEAALTIAADGPYTMQASGTADVNGMIDPRFGRLAAPAVAFDLATAWSPADQMVTMTKARFSSAAGMVDAKGRFDTGTYAIGASASVRMVHPDVLTDMIHPFRVGRASGTVSVGGSLFLPNIRAEMELGDIRGPGAAAGDGTADINISADDKAGEKRWKLDGKVDLGAIKFDDPRFAGLAETDVSARFSGTFDRKRGLLKDARIHAVTKNVTLRATGHMDVAAVAGVADLNIAIRDLVPISRIASTVLGGRLDLEAQLSFDRSQAIARVAAGTEGLTLANPVIMAMLGPRPRVDGTVQAKLDGEIVVTNLAIDGAGIKLNVASLTTDGRKVSATYRAGLHSLTPIAKALDIPLSGSVTVAGTAGGYVDNPHLGGRVDASALRWRARALGSAEGSYTVTSPRSDMRADITIAAATPVGEMHLGAKISMPGKDRVRLSEVLVRGSGIDMSGQLLIPTGGGAIEGELKANVANLAPWSSLAEVPIAGATEIKVRLASAEGRQAVELNVLGRDISLRGDPKIEALTAEASATDATEAIRGEWRIAARNLQFDAVRLSNATLTGRGGLNDVEVDFSAKGDPVDALDIAGTARIERAGGHMRVTLGRLTGGAAGQPVSLGKPGTLTTGAGKFNLSLLGIGWGDGMISATAHADGRTVSAEANVRRFPASAIAAFVPGLEASGRLGLDLTLKGPIADPSGDFRLTLANVKVKSGAVVDLPELRGGVSGKFRQSRLRLTGTIDGLGEAALRAHADIPLKLAVMPLSIVLPQDGPISGQVNWRGNIGGLALLLPLPGHRLSGIMAFEGSVDGTLGRPAIKGEIAWSGGTYENEVTGTILKDIDILAVSDGKSLRLSRASATDGGKGRMTAHGGARLNGADGMSLDLGVEIKRFTVARRDDVTASASGVISVRGSWPQMALSGHIATDHVDVAIVDSLPPGVVDLAVIEVNDGARAGPTQVSSEESDADRRVTLALDVDMPRRVYLRGRGLDSEWTGKLRIDGPAEAPVLKGELRPVRGRFDLAGKVFKLGGGRLTFPGGARVDPVVDITAEYKTKRITALVRITGTASRPKIELTSVPVLPQDEILSRVLFDKETGRLTPTEAAQLGVTLASLSGLDGGGLGLLDSVRRTLGVDALRVGKADNGEPTVGVGKYVMEDVYVGVDQGTTQKSGNVTVEVTVIPNVTVKSDVGADARSRVGVNWKWDY